MEPRVSYALVGLFVLVFSGAFIVLTLWLVGVQPTGESRTYALYLEESVAGVGSESPVKYLGVDVGKVTEISLDRENPGRVRLLLSVRTETPVSVDTVASLSTQGLTGLINYVELHGGGPDSAPLEVAPGEPYPVIPGVPSLTARIQEQGLMLMEQLQGAGGDLSAILAGLRELVGEDNRRSVAESLSGLREMTGTANQDAIGATLAEANRAAERIAAAAATLEGLAARLDPAVEGATRFGERLPGLAERAGQTLAGVEAAVGEMRRVAEGLGGVVEQAGPGLVDLSRQGLPQIAPLLRELRALTERLNHLAGALESEPNLLLYGRPRRPGPGER